MPKDTADRLGIRALIENWVLWRDARLWDRFRTVWHKEGQMWATWFQGSYEDFIKVSQEGYDRGVRIMHMLGGMTIDIKGKRAIAQTKMTISQRAEVEGVMCDVVCTGRFYDFLEKRKGRWGLVLRRLAYEKDRSIRSIPAPRPSSIQAAGALSRGLPPPRLSADQDRLQGEARHARARWAGVGRALRQGRGLAEGQEAAGLAGLAITARSAKNTPIAGGQCRGPSCHSPTSSICSMNSTSCA